MVSIAEFKSSQTKIKHTGKLVPLTAAGVWLSRQLNDNNLERTYIAD